MGRQVDDPAFWMTVLSLFWVMSSMDSAFPGNGVDASLHSAALEDSSYDGADDPME